MINLYTKKRFVAKFVRKAPVDCTEYAKNNIPNYDTITSIPDDFTDMDFSETENMTKAFQGMNKISSIYDLYLPKATDLTSLFGPITPVSSPTTSNTVSISVTPNIYAPIANVLDGFMYMTRIKYFEGKKIIVNKPSSMYSAFNNS